MERVLYGGKERRVGGEGEKGIKTAHGISESGDGPLYNMYVHA